MSSRKRIYVGNLPNDVREADVKDLFRKYGDIDFLDLKNRGSGPVFAFLDFADERDAEDAVRGRDGYDFDGSRLRVEFPRGAGPRGPGGRPLSEGGGYDRGYGGGRGGGGGGGRGGPPRRSKYRILVSGLPQSGSWQDLKDHLRNAGEICYADVFRDGNGAVEFARYEDMKNALRKFDDTKFKSHEGETAYIRLTEDAGGSGGGSRGGGGGRDSRSPPPRSSRRSPDYGGRRGRSRSRSAASGSRSRSRS